MKKVISYSEDEANLKYTTLNLELEIAKRNTSVLLIEFFTISISVRLSDRFLHREKQKNSSEINPQWGWKPGPLDLQANALPTELSQHSIASLNLHGLYKVMLYWF